jgi:hypothetical protein
MVRWPRFISSSAFCESLDIFIRFLFIAFHRGDTPVLTVRSICERLNSETFPYLKEIQIDDIKWPTSEYVVLCHGYHNSAHPLSGRKLGKTNGSPCRSFYTASLESSLQTVVGSVVRLDCEGKGKGRLVSTVVVEKHIHPRFLVIHNFVQTPWTLAKFGKSEPGFLPSLPCRGSVLWLVLIMTPIPQQ